MKTLVHLSGFAILGLALTASLQANYIRPGSVPTPPPGPKPAPTSFTETYTYTPPGGKPITFTITVTPGEAADDKADAIVAAITSAPVNGSASRDSNTTHPEEINSAGEIALVKSTSGETDKIFSLGPSLPGSYIAVAYEGTLTGTTYGGGVASQFDVSLGYDTVLSESIIAYDQLANQTVDGLMIATYENLLAGLPAPVQGNLSIDLTTDTIRFNLPDGAFDPFVMGNSTDQTATFSEAVVVTPEPSSLFLVGLGVLCVLASIRPSQRTSPSMSLTRSQPQQPLPASDLHRQG